MTTVETPVQELLTRTVEAALAGDGRTVEARIVPYNVTATVADPPHYEAYQEMFMPGAFKHQLSAANRVFLNFEHEQGLRGIVGHGETLEERPDGLYGSFRMGDNADSQKALELIHGGVLTGLSIEFKTDSRWMRRVDNVVQRFKAQLDRVSLCRFPAYQDATVLSVREQPAVPPPAFVPPVMPDGLAGRLQALSVAPLERVTVVRTAWDGSSGRFTDEQYAASCLIDHGGDGSVKARCSLPVLEPDGAVNANALQHAATVLVTRHRDGDAARRLLRFYRAAGMDPPGPLVTLARS